MKRDFVVDGVEWKIYDFEDSLWAACESLSVKVYGETVNELIEEAAKIQALLKNEHPSITVATYHPKDYALKGDVMVGPGDDVEKLLGKI